MILLNLHFSVFRPNMLMTKSFTITPKEAPFYKKNEKTIRFGPIVENIGKKASFYIDCFSTTDEFISGSGSIRLYIKSKKRYYVPYHTQTTVGHALRLIFRLEKSKNPEHEFSLEIRYKNEVNVLKRPLCIRLDHDYSKYFKQVEDYTFYNLPIFGVETIEDIEWMNEDNEDNEDIDKYFN